MLPERLPLFPDVAELVRLPLRKILVTTGIPAVRLQKVAALGLNAWLDAVHVDDALAVPRRGKPAVFAAILGMRTVHVARWGCSSECPATHCMPDLLGLAAVL